MSDDGRVGELGPVADQRGFGILGDLGDLGFLSTIY
jgi:hypothetical protein